MTPTKTDTRPTIHWLDVVALTAIWALIRLPFLGSFDLVSHDGCYYIAQARALLAGSPGAGGAFPPGYPLAIAAAMTAVADGVRAAQGVSAVAGLAATIALYALARVYLPRVPSLLCAGVFATTPAFVHASLTTMSESIYVAWLILALAAYARRRRVWCGLLMGVAAITRPEALGIAVVLFIVDGWKHRSVRSAAALVIPFALVYSANVVVPAMGGADVSIVPKSDQLGLGARGWRSAESGAGEQPGAVSLLAHYAGRLPVDAAYLFRHVAGLTLLLALFGMVRRPVVALVALVPFFVNPLFTLRPEARFVVPFIPFVALFAFLGAAALQDKRTRRAVFVLLAANAAVGAYANRGQLTTPVSEGAEPARAAALRLRGQIPPGASIAGRKPFIAFYLEGRYVEIPLGDYDGALGELVERGVDYIAVMKGVTDFFRPEFSPLLYDEATIVGDPRLTQVYADDDGVSVFALGAVERAARTTVARGLSVESPRWRRDGRVVYAAGETRKRRLHLVAPLDTAAARSYRLEDGFRVSGLAPAPDGSRVAFVSSRDANPDIFILEPSSGAITALTRSRARDVDPAWDPAGAIVFASDRGGEFELYRIRPGGGSAIERLGARGRHPRVSHDGTKLAWAKPEGGIGVRDIGSGSERALPSPRRILSAPSWSHDRRYLAVAASDLGSPDVYVVDVESGRALRLTPTTGWVETAPDWHPTLPLLLYASGMQRPNEVIVLDGLGPHLQRLDAEPPRVYARAR